MAVSRDDFSIAFRSALLQRGGAQKFSILSLFILAIFIFFLDVYGFSVVKSTRSIINDIIFRVSYIVSSPSRIWPNASKGLADHFYLKEENEELKKVIENYKSLELNLEFLSNENKNLRKILDSENINNAKHVVLAKVLVDRNSPFLKSIIINKGIKSGIKKGLPVTQNNYLIGRIVETNYLSSRILLLNDLNSKLPVVIEPSATQGILSGSGEVNPTLYYLPQQFKTSKESTVFTSGKDGIFPSGIPVGKVLVEENSVNVKLFSDPGQLFYVNIIVDDFTDTNF